MGVLTRKQCEETHERFEKKNSVRIPMSVLKGKRCEDTHEHFEQKKPCEDTHERFGEKTVSGYP